MKTPRQNQTLKPQKKRATFRSRDNLCRENAYIYTAHPNTKTAKESQYKLLLK